MNYEKVVKVEREIKDLKEKKRFITKSIVKKRSKLIAMSVAGRIDAAEIAIKEIRALEKEETSVKTALLDKETEYSAAVSLV